MATNLGEDLILRFHGRIIDSLGIQMYQSPVAAIAEMIANAWDADASFVDVKLPEHLGTGVEIVIKDDGIGMTYYECQNFYLDVGRNRRVAGNTSKSPMGRPLLGRKGIGKFAGFGIADVICVDTTSQATGERTVFELDLRKLRGNSYANTDGFKIPVLERMPPSKERTSSHGTEIHLKNLKLTQVRRAGPFAKSMSRRFLITQHSDTFKVRINGEKLPEHTDVDSRIEFDFPSDCTIEEKRMLGVKDEEDGWGKDTVGQGVVKWRIRFTKTPIDVDEFRGVSVFCGAKVAQTPFFFNLSGGVSGQHGLQYMTGVIRADYLDQLKEDIITTERQRLNWENNEARKLQEWGKSKIKQLLTIWKERRAESKLNMLNMKVSSFSERLNKFPPSEKKVVENALRKVASIEALDDGQFETLSNSMLTAWEGGRLKELITDISEVQSMDEKSLLRILSEAQVLSALQVAEAVKAKLDIINGLRKRIEARELENAVRDYIAKSPWLLSPQWETFTKETSINRIAKYAAGKAQLTDSKEGRGRVDLVLASGNQLLVIEFMRPGSTVDRDHLERFSRYIDIIRERVQNNSELKFSGVDGLLVADNLSNQEGISALINRLSQSNMQCIEWNGLLEKAGKQWDEFLDVLITRAPDDQRVQALANSRGADNKHSNE